MVEQSALQSALLCLLCCAVVTAGPAVEPIRFEIVVHPHNPLETISRKEASRIFLKKRTAWPDGSDIAPLDQSPGTERSVRAGDPA